jgi:hypothetical protein
MPKRELQKRVQACIGAAKWCKEHIPRKGNDFTDEGLLILDDMELWWEKEILLWACHNSAVFTSDWYLRQGESRDKLGEWLKKTTVRSQETPHDRGRREKI